MIKGFQPDKFQLPKEMKKSDTRPNLSHVTIKMDSLLLQYLDRLPAYLDKVRFKAAPGRMWGRGIKTRRV